MSHQLFHHSLENCKILKMVKIIKENVPINYSGYCNSFNYSLENSKLVKIIEIIKGNFL